MLASNVNASFASWVTEMAGLVVILGGIGATLVFLSKISRQWERMQLALQTVADQLKEVIRDKDKEHAEIRATIVNVDSRLQQHEKWHMENPRLTG